MNRYLPSQKGFEATLFRASTEYHASLRAEATASVIESETVDALNNRQLANKKKDKVH